MSIFSFFELKCYDNPGAEHFRHLYCTKIVFLLTFYDLLLDFFDVFMDDLKSRSCLQNNANTYTCRMACEKYSV